MHIRDVLIDKGIPFTEVDGHITVTNTGPIGLSSSNITVLENITFISERYALQLHHNPFTEMKNVHFKGRWIDLMPCKSNLDGLTIDLTGEVSGALLYSSEYTHPRSRKYLRLFTDREVFMNREEWSDAY